MTSSCIIAVSAVAGSLLAAALACIPGLHIYNVMGIMALLMFRYHSTAIAPEIIIPVSISLVTAYAVISNIPSVLLAAPDESSLFTVLPGQKYFFKGQGLDAISLVGVGSAIGLLLVILVIAPAANSILPMIYKITQHHTHWIIWCVITFMLMSEWPRGTSVASTQWQRFGYAWKPLLIGLAVFLLSGLLGFIIFFGAPVRPERSFLNLMPAFVGLFTIPWLLLNIIAGSTPPTQKTDSSICISKSSLLHGGLAGLAGGGFAAFFPVVTGGVGGFLAGHALTIRNDKVFLISQGTAKVIYYTGGLLLFFAPRLNMRRGGAAWMISGITTNSGQYEFFIALAAIAISGMMALLLIHPLARLTLTAISYAGFRRISITALLITISIITGITGLSGLLVMLVATGIGLLPPLFGTRRMNALGIILLPIACSMSGIGFSIAHWMKLV